jgi:hypothetical protein
VLMSKLCCQSLSGVIICLLQAPRLRAPCVTYWVYNYTGRKEGGSGPAATYLIKDNTRLPTRPKRRIAMNKSKRLKRRRVTSTMTSPS